MQTQQHNQEIKSVPPKKSFLVLSRTTTFFEIEIELLPDEILNILPIVPALYIQYSQPASTTRTISITTQEV